MPFEDADAALRLTRFERFDAGFDTAYVFTGDLHIGGDWTGGQLFRAADADLDDGLIAFVIDGDLTVDGTLALDEDAEASFALMVTGALRADVVTLDATMLFVYQNATVTRLIDFATTDGTLSVAGRTNCPIIISDEGDLNVNNTGHVLCRRYATLPEGAGHTGDDVEETGWGWTAITLSRAEVPATFVAGLYGDDHRVDNRLAVQWAREGRPLLITQG
ncbi:hypothetical protein GCM10010532_050600 [Dactylosporangium siamense]|uniref:Uncharacterized protein n=1 Tax=Dactylosporangium siamense TaxID=685454 RepID=A0A919PNU1_9ACTN|nr:hypothetical protein Dsi01nite_035990 [Dactylosporangium siamense]